MPRSSQRFEQQEDLLLPAAHLTPSVDVNNAQNLIIFAPGSYAAPSNTSRSCKTLPCRQWLNLPLHQEIQASRNRCAKTSKGDLRAAGPSLLLRLEIPSPGRQVSYSRPWIGGVPIRNHK